MEPDFLSVADVRLIHRDQLARYGGAPGVRTPELLESAVAMPTASFGGEFLHEDLAAMAAAYLWHLVCDHPFVDGNKRTGLVAAVVFLALNGQTLAAPEDDLEALVWSVARGERDKAQVATFLRRHLSAAAA